MNRMIKTVLAITMSAHAAVMAQDAYPARPISLVTGYAPGGSSDAVARIFGEALGKELGQPIVVINKPGAGTTIAADSVARAQADGYTLYLGSASLMGGDKALYKTVKYEPTDFTPITRVSVSPLLLSVSKDSSITSVADLVAKAKQNPGKLYFSSAGSGSIIHIAAVQFTNLAKVDLTHVPYKGGAPSVTALAAGEVHVSFSTAASVKGMIDAGKVVGLAVTTANRSPLLPQYPTIAEAGVEGYDIANWFGVFAPANTPSAVLNLLYTASVKVLKNPDVKQKLSMRGEQALPSASMAEFKEFAMREGQLSATLVKLSGAKIE
jgi:tripartite-type tricarboxylate transporter receptor subunit TctC